MRSTSSSAEMGRWWAFAWPTSHRFDRTLRSTVSRPCRGEPPAFCAFAASISVAYAIRHNLARPSAVRGNLFRGPLESRLGVCYDQRKGAAPARVAHAQFGAEKATPKGFSVLATAGAWLFEPPRRALARGGFLCHSQRRS